ncbi:MAG: NfeD family protein [Planctomycetales bacterium]|nr:NfeD family protein [Planctomycetales bacterium]
MDAFYLALLLYIAALVLAFVDLFLPSGGLLIVLAVLAAFASILFGFRSGTAMGMTMLTIVAASVPAFAFAAIKIWPLTPIGRRIILGLPPQNAAKTSQDEESLQLLVGQVLITEHALLPTGQLRVGYRRLNAVAENGMIEAGQRVKIIAVRERNLVVRLSDEPITRDYRSEVAQGPAADPSASTQEPPNLLDRPAEEIGLDSLD